MSGNLIFTLLFGFGLIGPTFMLMTVAAVRYFNPDSILHERSVYYKVVFSIYGVGMLIALITFLTIYLMSK